MQPLHPKNQMQAGQDTEVAFLSGSVKRIENIAANRPLFSMPNNPFVWQAPVSDCAKIADISNR
jgi:hypothetical protein